MPLTLSSVSSVRSLLESDYQQKRPIIQQRLGEFSYFLREGSDEQMFHELAYCVLTANTSAKMGERCLGPLKAILLTGSVDQLQDCLHAHHCRFWRTRGAYLAHIREYLDRTCGLKLKSWLTGFEDPQARRDALVVKDMKGIWMKEASHFMRNVGFRGYAILDLHILNSMKEFKVIRSVKRPTTRDQYVQLERKLLAFARDMNIDPDELDLLLWSRRTGEILK